MNIQSHFNNIPKYPWRQLLNITMTSLCEYSKYQWRHFVNIQNASFEYSKAVAMVILKHSFEYSRSDVIGLLNTHEVTSMVIHEVTSCSVIWGNLDADVIGYFEILRSWRHGYFEYSCHGYFEHSRLAVMGIFKADAMGILNIHSDIGILNILEVTSLL